MLKWIFQQKAIFKTREEINIIASVLLAESSRVTKRTFKPAQECGKHVSWCNISHLTPQKYPGFLGFFHREYCKIYEELHSKTISLYILKVGRRSKQQEERSIFMTVLPSHPVKGNWSVSSNFSSFPRPVLLIPLWSDRICGCTKVLGFAATRTNKDCCETLI